MSIVELGALGEFFGAIAVVVTLIYLAGQLRQNTKALRASTYDSYANSGTAINDFAARHADELAKIAGMETGDFIYQNFAQKVFNLMETTYLHHREGLLDEQIFEARVRGFGNVMRTQEGLRQIWDDAPVFYTDEFCDFMAKRIIGSNS